MFDPSAPHIIILLVVVLLLFGSRRLPGAAKSLGQSMHIFKKSVAGLNSDDEQAGSAASQGFTTPPSFTATPPALAATQSAPTPDQQTQQIQDLQRQAASESAGQTSQPG